MTAGTESKFKYNCRSRIFVIQIRYLRGHQSFSVSKNTFLFHFISFSKSQTVYKCSLESIFKNLITYRRYRDSCHTVRKKSNACCTTLNAIFSKQFFYVDIQNISPTDESIYWFIIIIIIMEVYISPSNQLTHFL